MSKVLAPNRLKSTQPKSHSASKLRTKDATILPIPRASSSSKTKKLPPLDLPPSPSKKNANHPTDNNRVADSSSSNPPVTTQDVLRICQESDCLKVVSVELHGCKLTRICDLTKFTRVKSLDVSGNFLTKIEGLDANQQLKHLKLYDNKIRVVENLDCLVQLDELQLQYNLIDIVGSGLVALKNLTSLRLDNNKLKSLTVHELSPVAKTLKSLDISYNELEEASAVVALKLLEELKVNGNRLKTLPSLKGLEKLSDLEVADNALRNLRGLDSCLCLTSLNASRNKLNDDSFSQLKTGFERLDSMDLSENAVSSLEDFGRLFPKLSILNVSRNNISDPTQFGELRLECLKELDTRFNDVDVNAVDLHGSFPALEMADGRVVGEASTMTTNYLALDAMNVHPIGRWETW